jgi:predicted transcriptional regulator
MADKKVTVYPLRLDSKIYERLKDFAVKQDLNTSQIIRRAIRKELKVIEAEAIQQQE